MDMEGVNLYVDPKSAACGAVGGLLVGAILSTVLVSRSFGKRIEALEAEIEDLTTHFLTELDKQRRSYEDEYEERIARGVANYLSREYQPSDVRDEHVVPPGWGLRPEDFDVKRSHISADTAANPAVFREKQDDLSAAAAFVEQQLAEGVLDRISEQPIETADEDDDSDADEGEPDDIAVEVPRNIFQQPPSVPASLGQPLRSPVPIIASTSPHMITQEEFGEFWGTATVKYWTEDDVLTDENDSPVNDMIPLVGPDIADKFGLNPADPHVVLIRCPRLELDYEVAKVEGSYHRDILGHDPSDPPLPPRQARVIVRNRNE